MAFAKVDGLEQAFKRLEQEISKVKGRTVDGLMAGGLIIQAEAQRHVPVEYGELRASGFTMVDPMRPDSVIVGFTAPYALWVHENMEQKLKGKPRRSGIGVYWGPDGHPKYLETAVRVKTPDVIQAVKSRAVVR